MPSRTASLLRFSAALILRDDKPLPARPWLRRVLRQFARDGDEEFVDVRGRLCTRLHEEDAVVACIRLRLLWLYFALRVEVGLVAGQRDNNVRVALPLKLLHPLLGTLKRVPVCDIIDDNCSCSAAIVHGRKTVVPLLARSVPDLKLDCRVVERDSLRQEGCADCGLLILKELTPHKAQHQ
eukprot:CAMPEP_0115845666 /NCGR_PEP_ID=MMETSP0287-20121206/9472_1 /TAXON_ID=412157 /ORGANISM="Chrysochromulina rotalis, Strain UIO044" /LENGTH=180 /DNA_ID=CAMNT_0003299451 /DNA_START=552 /DNA_END=1094 /DNA_ORIENTATION=+